MLENDQLNKKPVERGVLRNGCWELSLLFNQLPVGCFSWLGLFLTDGETRTVWSWFLSDRGWDIFSVYKQMDPPHDLSGGGDDKRQSQGWNPIRDITGSVRWLICMRVCPCRGKGTSLWRICAWQLCSLSSTVRRHSAGAGAQLLTVRYIWRVRGHGTFLLLWSNGGPKKFSIKCKAGGQSSAREKHFKERSFIHETWPLLCEDKYITSSVRETLFRLFSCQNINLIGGICVNICALPFLHRQSAWHPTEMLGSSRQVEVPFLRFPFWGCIYKWHFTGIRALQMAAVLNAILARKYEALYSLPASWRWLIAGAKAIVLRLPSPAASKMADASAWGCLLCSATSPAAWFPMPAAISREAASDLR